MLIIFSCEPEEKKQIKPYEGPLREMENVEVLHTERDKLKVKVLADKIVEFQDGDQEFSEGIYLEFFDEFGAISSTLRADHAYRFKKDNKWRGRGDVQVKNFEKQQQLNTEELFWEPATKKIYTDKFVTIRDRRDVIYGTGLDADQNLTNYVITKPEGEFEVADDQ